MKPRTISLAIIPTLGAPPSHLFPQISWYPGMRVLDALTIADAALEDTFMFRAVFGSRFGVFVDQIGGISDTNDRFWMLYIDDHLSDHGVSDTVIRGAGAQVEFRLERPHADHPQAISIIAIKDRIRTGK